MRRVFENCEHVQVNGLVDADHRKGCLDHYHASLGSESCIFQKAYGAHGEVSSVYLDPLHCILSVIYERDVAGKSGVLTLPQKYVQTVSAMVCELCGGVCEVCVPLCRGLIGVCRTREFE